MYRITLVRTGPADALLHKSQIIDDHVRTDTKQGIIHTKSGKVLRIGSRIRVRITTVSVGKGAAVNGKIGITCRQPFLVRKNR